MRSGVVLGLYARKDYTFLHQFLGRRTTEAVTKMVFLDDADNGALQMIPGSQLVGPRFDNQDPRTADSAP